MATATHLPQHQPWTLTSGLGALLVSLTLLAIALQGHARTAPAPRPGKPLPLSQLDGIQPTSPRTYNPNPLDPLGLLHHR